MENRRKKVTKIPIYFGLLILIQTEDFEAIAKEYDLHIDGRGFDALAFRSPLKNGFTRYVIVFDSKPTNKIIAHECTHVVNFIFADRDIKLDLNNDEPQAYLMGWVFEQCDKFLNSNNK